jgi:PAS domain S-box-containing protein
MYSQTDEGNPGFSEYTMEKVIADTLREGGVRAFYDAFHQNTVYCTVSSIHPTGDPKRQSSPAGFILVAKVFDYPYLQKLSESLKYSVQITRQRPGDEMVNEKYNTRIVKALTNHRNETAAWLIFESSNPFLQRLRSLGNLILFGTMGFIFIFLMIQFFLIQQWISSPLGLISQSLKNSDPEAIHELTYNGNEFADVAQLIERSSPVLMLAAGYTAIEEIKERARTEARLREMEEQTRKILLTIPEAIVVTDLDGHILSMNDEALRMLGESNLQRLISGSMKLEDSVIRADRKHLRNMFQDLFKGLYVRNQELSLLNSLGEDVPALVSASVIMDDDNKPLKLVFSSRDLSDMKELEIQLRQSQKMESIGTMAGGIAHDFNNIITIIAGYVALSAGKIEVNAEAQNDLDEALKACLRAKSLISKILTFTRKGEQDVEEVVVADVIEDTLPMIRAIIPAKVSILTEINSHSYARVDCTEMQQVMLNLATNAFHAMQPDGGTLKISLEEKAGFELIGIDPKVLLESPYLHLSVSDTGSGIAPELISRIFDPYFSTKASGEGTGLGLSIVHGIVSGYRFHHG